jgi:hypothetical protein
MGKTLVRIDEPVERPLQTVFGHHTIQAYVYAPGPHEKIDLRPVDVRLQLSDRQASYLLEEFSQYFCVDQAFQQAAQGIELVLNQKISVDVLERTNRRMGGQAEAFLDQLPRPAADQEGELLVFTGDGKGVPLVKEDARALAAFEDRAERPGNRRMAILAGVYSVDRYVRTPEEIVAALFRDGERPQRSKRPEPRCKHVRACFPKAYDADTDQPTLVPGAFEAFGWAHNQVFRQLFLTESPAGLVHLVDALVADVAVAVVPEPVPASPLCQRHDGRHPTMKQSEAVWGRLKGVRGSKPSANRAATNGWVDVLVAPKETVSCIRGNSC